MFAGSVVVLLSAFCAPPSVVAPHDAAGCLRRDVADAIEDLLRLPAAERLGVRYVSLYATDDELLDKTVAAVNLTVNVVSRSAAIAQVESVPGTSLLRIRWPFFANDRSDLEAMLFAWERLAELDPYYHLRTTVATGAKDGKDPETKTITTDGGWLDLGQAAKLRELSGSIGAILRADYFVDRATRAPGYYDLAGIPPTRNEFLAALGIDPKLFSKLVANNAAALVESGVTKTTRTIIRRQGPFGGAWETLDVEDPSPDRDVFRNPLRQRFDAGEHIAAKRNGLHWFGLYNAAGERADFVPQEIVPFDDSEPHGDGIVRPGISCIRCHVEDGLRPFTDDLSAMLDAGRVSILSDDATVIARIRGIFDPEPLQRGLIRDREDYAAAVELATGLSVKAAAESLATVVRSYRYTLVTPEVAAVEVCLPTLEAFGGSADFVLVRLLDGRSVQRLQWETSFYEAATRAVANQAR